MAIESVTCNGVRVDLDGDRDGIWIVNANDQLFMGSDGVCGLLEALGLLGFDLTGYTLPSVAGDEE